MNNKSVSDQFLNPIKGYTTMKNPLKMHLILQFLTHFFQEGKKTSNICYCINLATRNVDVDAVVDGF